MVIIPGGDTSLLLGVPHDRAFCSLQRECPLQSAVVSLHNALVFFYSASTQWPLSGCLFGIAGKLHGDWDNPPAVVPCVPIL